MRRKKKIKEERKERRGQVLHNKHKGAGMEPVKVSDEVKSQADGQRVVGHGTDTG